MERAVLLAEGAVLLPEHLALGRGDCAAAPAGLKSYGTAKREALDRFTRDYVERLMREHGGNVSRAARNARIPRQTLHRLLRLVSDPMSQE